MSNINLFLGDSLEAMRSMPDKCYDLAIVDPPYGIKDDGRRHNGRVFKKDGEAIKKYDSRNGRQILIKPHSYKLSAGYDNEQPTQEYFDELFRVAKYHIIWGENYLQFRQKSSSNGRIIWDKVNGDTDQSDCEVAWTNLFSSVRLLPFMWFGMLQGKSLLEPRTSQGNKNLCEKRIHPNHKPVPLYKGLLSYAKPGDKILDTHGGSGSILIACHEMGFDLDWYEIDEDYFLAAKNRFNEHKSKVTLFPAGTAYEKPTQTRFFSDEAYYGPVIPGT